MRLEEIYSDADGVRVQVSSGNPQPPNIRMNCAFDTHDSTINMGGDVGSFNAKCRLLSLSTVRVSIFWCVYAMLFKRR